MSIFRSLLQVLKGKRAFNRYTDTTFRPIHLHKDNNIAEKRLSSKTKEACCLFGATRLFINLSR